MRQHIVVVGGANVDVKARIQDETQHGTSNPGTVWKTPGGVGRNIAANLGALGCSVQFIGPFGDDEDGRRLRAQLQTSGVSTHFAPTLPDKRTGSYVALLGAQGDLELAVADMAIMDGFSPTMLDDVAAVFDGASVVCLDANLPVDTLHTGLRGASNLQLRTVVEPVSAPKARKLLPLLPMIDTVTPNRDELAAMTEMPVTTTEEIEEAARALHARGVRRVIVTLGVEGVFCYDDDGGRCIPSAAVDVTDATGAGDAFTSGLIYGYHQQWSIADCIDFGQRLAVRILVSTDSVLGGRQL